VIEQEQIDLILYFIKIRECRVILDEYSIQSTIVENYMKFGSKMYYGAEMLIYIYKLNWNNDLTKDLCRNIMRTIKTKDILNCHSPVLTCLLLAEFLNQISNFSVQHSTRCEKVVNELMQFCQNIQEANHNENYIKFLMKQKDSRGRSSLQIASDNSFYQVLQTAEIGTIVKKMWNGFISNNGFLAASSMHRYLDSNQKMNDPFNSFDILDNSKNYFYQLSVWTNSCSLRYWPESVSTVVLIAVYNFFIYFLVKRGQTMNKISYIDYDLKCLLIIYITWVICLNLNILNLMLFGYKSRRKFHLDMIGYIEILMLFSACALLIDPKNITKEYENLDLNSVFNNISDSLLAPITRGFGIQVTNFSGNNSFLFRVVLLAINDILVWFRIIGILLTFKEIGPLIRMIYLMTILLLKNFIIFGLYITCCAAIFTAIFNKRSSQFRDFSTTIITLVGGFMNNFDTENFDTPIYHTFGSISLMIYICVSGVLLINLLIALLSNVYENLNVLVDASHRSVLISFYRKYRWDEENGYMIFLTTPINVVNFLVLPFSFCFTKGNKKKLFNDYVCRVYYLLFYFPLIFIIFIFYSLIIVPICYIKGIICAFGYFVNLKMTKILKIVKIFKWILWGFYYLMFVYIRDIYYMLKSIFFKAEYKTSVMNRFKIYIKPDEVVIFLKFIHSRKPDQPNDIHSLFMDYLLFEQKKKIESDCRLKEKVEYISRLNSVIKKKSLVSNSNKGSVLVNLNNKNNNFESQISSNYIKKNFIIIEILENFLIDEGSNNGIIDIEKLKLLLPKSMNIDNAYIKRLVHTDISSLSKAVNKLKSKKNLFLQYQILNKIVQSAIRLDKEIDSEIMKNLRLQRTEKDIDIMRDANCSNSNENDLQKDSMDEFTDLDHSRQVLKLMNKLIVEFNEVIGKKK